MRSKVDGSEKTSRLKNHKISRLNFCDACLSQYIKATNKVANQKVKQKTRVTGLIVERHFHKAVETLF